MSCCSGPSQITTLAAIVSFRPRPTIEHRMRVVCSGEDGLWTGRTSGRYDFGSMECGCTPLTGKQRVTIQLALECNGEEDGELTLRATFTITVGTHSHRGVLKPTEFNCIVRNAASWQNLFLGQLGQASILVRTEV